MSVRRAQLVTTAFRSFFRFLFQKGELQTNLAASVPTVADWRLSTVPKYLTRRKSNGCSKPATVARRPAAATTPSFFCLPVSAFGPGKWWRSSSTTSTGEPEKSSFEARVVSRPDAPACGCGRGPGVLPASRSPCLPNAPGVRLHEGATPWLCWPLDTDDDRSPRTRPRGLTPHFKGAHLFRHSLATSMLRSGATMGEIGEVLRHRVPNTTEIYAKVDFDGLRSLAHPWPIGGAQ